MSILRVENVSFSYKSKYLAVEVLKDVSCEFSLGKVYSIVGESGSGKSTLLSLLAGLGKPDTGKIFYNDKNICDISLEKYRAEFATVIYQNFNLLPKLNVFENAFLPYQIAKTYNKTENSKSEMIEKVKTNLQKVGIDESKHKRYPTMLSGGEQQRVAIVRAMTSPANIILADEPTGNLDSQNSEIVVNLLKDLAEKENYCVIIVTHDTNIANQSDVIYTMKDGRMTK